MVHSRDPLAYFAVIPELIRKWCTASSNSAWRIRF